MRPIVVWSQNLEEATHLRMSFPFFSLFSYGFAPRPQVQNCSAAVTQAVKTLKETSSFYSEKQEWGLCRAECGGR